MLSALSTEPFKYQVIIWLALSTGLRQGELFGLSWKYVDFESHTVRVSKQHNTSPEKEPS
jgi:integrase